MSEVIRVLDSDCLWDVDAKAVFPYLPLLEIFRAARIKDISFGASAWKENSRGEDGWFHRTFP